MPTHTRLTVNINPETKKALEEIAKNRHVTVTEVIRRAVALYAFIEKEIADGNRVQIDDGQKIRELYFFA